MFPDRATIPRSIDEAAHADAARADEWMWGWDPTPGIVSVWAEPDGRAWIWRRDPASRALVCERERFEPWIVIDRIDDLGLPRSVTVRELDGPGTLRFRLSALDTATLHQAVLRGASRRYGRRLGHLRDLGAESVLLLPPEEQYLVATGRTYFRDLPFEALRRLQIDLETTGLDPSTDRIFLIAIRDPDGKTVVLGDERDDEAALIARAVEHVRAADPDVIENHNLQGFDLPFLDRRARRLGVPLALGRAGAPGLRTRGARRGSVAENDPERRVRYTIPGRELIDTLDAVLRQTLGADALGPDTLAAASTDTADGLEAPRESSGRGLKHVARQLGIARVDREHVPGNAIHAVYQRDPERVRRYAADDVDEVEGVARLLGGAAFALARMVPRRYERLADAGAATGILDPLLVRAYLRSGAALPAHQPGDGTTHDGAALHLFAAGVAHRIVKADVASLYPSLMREYRIGPARDRLGVMLALVDRLVEQRLAAKARARAAPAGSPARAADEALSSAMKLVVNSAYGYLAAGGLTRFADVHAANDVTRRGRELLGFLCRELAARGVTLIEADTDGVYVSVPPEWTEADERRAVADVAALLPARVRLEFEGRYAAMLSHEPKNYALLPYGGGPLLLRGVAFRSSRAEPFGEHFLRRAIARLLAGDVPGVQAAYVATVDALRRRALPTRDVAARVRLTKTPDEYLATREGRRELAYEAMLAAGRDTWAAGERVRVYRAAGGRAALFAIADDAADPPADPPRDYDAEHYVRVLRGQFASRLVAALAPEDFAAVFEDPEQPSLFARSLAGAQPVLTRHESALRF